MWVKTPIDYFHIIENICIIERIYQKVGSILSCLNVYTDQHRLRDWFVFVCLSICFSVRSNVCTFASDSSLSIAGEYVISASARNHVSGVSDKVSVIVEPAVPDITIEALGSVCSTEDPCLFVAKLKNGTLAPQGTFIYRWSNQVRCADCRSSSMSFPLSLLSRLF